MSEDGFFIEAEDKERIYVYRWLPGKMKPLKCIIQIAHGMAEHAGRYREFAAYLNSLGIGVYANDHRGHGKTADKLENVGYFADKNGWGLVVNDMLKLTKRIRNTHDSIPVFLFGQSMGSFLVRDYISRPEAEISGAILAGTAGPPGLQGHIAVLAAKLRCLVNGNKNPDKFLDKLVFGSYNRGINNPSTKFDWLSRDGQVVNNYVMDEFCGGVFTSRFFVDLFSGLMKISNRLSIDSIPSDLPLLFISGDQDPLSENLKGVKRLLKALKKSGKRTVEYKFYKNGRHEMLNEVNKTEVFTDISEWIGKKLVKE